MATVSSRTLQIQFSGDIAFNEPFSALDNPGSLAQIDLVTLVVGANVIAVPIIAGVVATALTILPPSGNVNSITLKGIAGDTGIPLHKLDPTSIAIDVSFGSLVLTVAVQINGVRLIWS